MRGRHDNHQRFEVSATNGSRPLAGGRLCGRKVSELFRTGEWICSRGNSWREVLDRLLSVRLAAISTRSHRTVLRGRDEAAGILVQAADTSVERAETVDLRGH